MSDVKHEDVTIPVVHEDITIAVVQEVATIRKRVVERERVVVRKTVDERAETVQAVLRHQDVTVEHVAVGQVVDAVPAIREVDGVTIIPVVEERLVVRTELFLREELHIRKAVRMQPTEQTVRLRRDVVAIERHETPPNTLGETSMAMTDTTYDAALHEDQVVALYETRAEAQLAMDKLTAAGLAEGAHISDHTTGAAATGATMAEDEGIWSSIKKLFVPEEEATGYAEGLRRGHALLIVHPTAATREHVIDLLDSTNPIDFDNKVEEWRGAGWTGGAATTGMAATTMATTTTATTGVTGAALTGQTATTAGLAGEDRLEVMEERLRVGKRDVSRGGMRVRSYIVERPVEESVTLREESIHLDRRPVDRALAPGEAAFQDRTVELTATAEEAIVAKQARVVEEISLRKDATERTETIHDTVRHTEVEIEDTRTVEEKALAGTATTTSTTTTTGTTKTGI